MSNIKQQSALNPLNADQIFIGEISTNPTVGKIFSKRDDYLLAVEQVKESIEFLVLYNETKNTTAILDLRGKIEVDIEENEECISLCIWFKGRNYSTGFSGLTDSKGIGYAKFLESYAGESSIFILLICRETNEETLVLGIKNVNLKTL